MAAESKFSLLFRKYVDGTAIHDERLEFLALADQEDMQAQLAQLIDAELRLRGTEYNLDKEEQQEILSNIYKATPEKPDVITKVISMWKVLQVAAAIIVVLGIGFYFFNAPRRAGGRPELTSGPHYTNDVKPGKNTATITLANGKTINLSTAKTGVVIDASSLKYNDGSLIEVNSAGAKQELTTTTPRGGTYQIILPDGTKVWLNAASSIRFPSTFAHNTERKVTLIGEAYFEVTKNKKMPFIVLSKDQQVEVLGTHFNINTYEDQEVKTTLLEGAVRVSLANHKSLKLVPGQQSVNDGKNLVAKTVDPEEVIDWKDNLFIFNEEDIQSVMKRLARWYNIEVAYEGDAGDATFIGQISTKRNLSGVLQLMERSGKVSFRVEGKKVTVISK